jgi:hypothetical protein
MCEMRRRPGGGGASATAVRSLAARRRKRTYLAAGVVAAVAVTICVLTFFSGESPGLRWRSPQLLHPEVIHASQGFNHLHLAANRDYIVVLPRPRLVGSLWIQGGHSLVIIGGHVTVPTSANQLDNDADDTDDDIYLEGQTGTVHLEGLLLDAMHNVMFDAIDINAPRAVVEIERVRVTGLYGSDRTQHADAVQTWGGVRTLRIFDLSIVGDYQGLTVDPALGPVGDAEIDNVDLTLEPVPTPLRAISVGGGHMIWLTRAANTCESGRVKFSRVYLLDLATRQLPPRNTVWPQVDSALPCRAHLQAGRVFWPRLPVTGSVVLSAPPHGSFVPSGSVGANYQRTRFVER